MSRENIVLIGFMGSGKSSVGRMIAAKLDQRFVDTDHLIVQKNGVEISEIFKNQGESYFRDQERLALESLQDADRCVIATGGGIVSRPENIPLLHELGFVVWLTAEEEVIFERVSRNTKRPLLQTANPRETISGLLALRNPLYAAAAQFTLDTSNFPHAGIAETIIGEAALFFEAERKK
ncbi:MAG: shikimate kinase [Verrucomicrobiota bacterium]